MNQEKIERLIRIFHLKYSLPILMTIISIYFWFTFSDHSFIKIVGMAINIIGLILWWVAKITLAKNWNVGFGKPKINQLVTHGVYSKISHPIYWGVNLTLFGLILVYPKPLFSVICLLFIIYFFSRMKVENAYLSENLGEEYKNYKRKTWI